MKQIALAAAILICSTRLDARVIRIDPPAGLLDD